MPTSKWAPDALTLRGEVEGKPNQAYSVQIFGSPRTDSQAKDPHASGEGQIYLGTAHAVIGSNGKLTGYGGGLHRKQALLTLERPMSKAPQQLELLAMN